jgi:hypothetical protein
MAFLTRTDGYQTMGDTNKNVTKNECDYKGGLLYRNSFPWITFISYETSTMVKKIMG